jgi:hypothetical protein
MTQMQQYMQQNQKHIPIQVQHQLEQMKKTPLKQDISNLINKLDVVCKSKEEQEKILQ